MLNKVTIKDVAKAAGVSISTVSQALNNYPSIKESTRKKVLEIARELHYTPNFAARNLATKTKKTIALVLNEINVTRGVAIPLEILNGVIERLDASDYDFVFYATTLKKQQEKSLTHFFVENNLAGLIIQGLKTTDPYYKELEESTLPVVAIDLDVKNPEIGTVSIDNEAAAREVTRRLMDKQLTKIIFVNGTPDAAVSKARELGYRSTASHASVVYANFREDDAYNWALTADNLEDYDAIFAASDLMAIGISKALHERGLTDKIALVGFDDITLGSYISPSLTTVRQNMGKIATQAAENLMVQIETQSIRHSLVDYAVIVRESADI
ncbi:MAG: LacI family transcriptional regulator [Streptococcaceae bacterium]|jgi:LacI family transcriptional regulator|nr:LacI family transcriptional regulator [Streptococcaceae bacterium]